MLLSMSCVIEYLLRQILNKEVCISGSSIGSWGSDVERYIGIRYKNVGDDKGDGDTTK